MTHWLMSLDGKPGSWADQTVDGEKTIELRRGPMGADEGDTVWIYATRPTAAVIGWATFRRCRPIEVEGSLMRCPRLLEAHRVAPLDVRAYAKSMRMLWAIEWSAAGRLRPSLALPLDTLRRGYGIKPTPTWVRLRDRGPRGGRPAMRGEALIRELQGRMPREVRR